MFADKNGGLLDRRLYKEKAVICIFIQRCVSRPSPQFQSNQHNDYCIDQSIYFGQDQQRSLSKVCCEIKIKSRFCFKDIDVRITCSLRKNCSGINFKRPSKRCYELRRSTKIQSQILFFSNCRAWFY